MEGSRKSEIPKPSIVVTSNRFRGRGESGQLLSALHAPFANAIMCLSITARQRHRPPKATWISITSRFTPRSEWSPASGLLSPKVVRTRWRIALVLTGSCTTTHRRTSQTRGSASLRDMIPRTKKNTLSKQWETNQGAKKRDLLGIRVSRKK
jgi:hypothetical protein